MEGSLPDVSLEVFEVVSVGHDDGRRGLTIL